LVAVSTRERPVDRGRRLATADRIRIGHELRVARQVVGESVHVVGSAIEMSGMQVSRIERGILPTVSIEQLARLGAAVGLDVRVRAYPGPSPVLDAAQMALLGRLRARLPKHLLFRTEVPLPSVGDQRAWDAYISRLVGIADVLPVEAETRLVDGQAQFRRISLKLRDSGLEHVLVVLADTRRNRDVLRSASSILDGDFPVSPRRALAALSAGHHPGGSAIVLI
jgi:transcriptional regulator with XRE-family HTH domain